MPSIALNIACTGWPDEARLQELAEISVTSVVVTADLKFPQGAELSLMFSDSAEIKRLNHKFRNIDKPTNVLSFPGGPIECGQSAGKILGDIAFSLQTISREADAENKNFDDHLSHLMIHGFLHLFGYDHQNDEDAEIMESIEITALQKLNIANPYRDQ